MAENVKVIVRCRPMNKKEEDLKCQKIVNTRNCLIEIYDPNDVIKLTTQTVIPKQFTFDSTYGEDSITEIIYNDICYPLIESVLEGYNATIFVYGQTGCGKSYTMEGVKSGEKGIISRCFEHIFEAIQVTSGVKYLALINYLEIYNEQIRDLLITNPQTPNNGDKNNLNLKETQQDGVIVSGLTSYPVHNVQECEYYLNLGGKNRIIGATLMNQNSSRSHSIFTINIEQIVNVNNNESIRKGKLNLVDLAGSERQAKTGATGDRFKEATKINLSLSALGNVISALVDGKTKHIPYRDSKLTRLLQDSLGGNTKTLMIACISPSSRDYVETLSTLRYANRAKNIHNKPHVNEDPKDAILRQYQEEIEHLKILLLNQSQEKINETIIETKAIEDNNNNNLNAKKDELLENYQMEMEKLKNLHETEKIEKENQVKQMELIKLEYERNIEKLNEKIRKQQDEKKRKKLTTKEEILNRIECLKKAMIGGEKANDKELSERRKRKKLEAEKRANVIAHLLAKIDMDEDREILQNQYKDISQELNLKMEALRRYKMKVKVMEKEIIDIQSEFEMEREDYLETIRKQEQHLKFFTQIAEKLSMTLRKECNYSDLETIKEQAVWLDDSQKFKLPELVIPRTKLPAPGRCYDIQTAPARLQYDEEDEFLRKKLENCEQDDIISNYFQPTMKRANELLNQSSKFNPNVFFNKWKDLTQRSKRNNCNGCEMSPPSTTQIVPSSDYMKKAPFRLEALPNIDRTTNQRKRQHLNTMELL